MLDPELFRTKYETKNTQVHEENFLETVNEVDRSKYSDLEILSGRTGGDFNNFYNYKNRNLGKKYKTIKKETNALFQEFIENKIDKEELNEVFEILWTESKKGSFKHLELLLNRMLGKSTENINIQTEEFSFVIDESQLINKKDNTTQ